MRKRHVLNIALLTACVSSDERDERGVPDASIVSDDTITIHGSRPIRIINTGLSTCGTVFVDESMLVIAGSRVIVGHDRRRAYSFHERFNWEAHWFDDGHNIVAYRFENADPLRAASVDVYVARWDINGDVWTCGDEVLLPVDVHP
jgi:hypothetical protein